MRSRALANLIATTVLLGLAIPLEIAAQEQQQQSPTFNVLYMFTGEADGGVPKQDFFLRDSKGDFFGTATGGGLGYGVVFKLDTKGHESAVYAFTGGADGAYPYTGLVQDAAGNLYGTTCCGGNLGAGVLFKIDTSGNETPLYTFTGGSDGGYPYAGLLRDTAGNLYGTATGGGEYGWGVVFKVDPTGKETPLYSFTGETDGAVPDSLIRDSAGNFYGTTQYGGNLNGCYNGCGVVFKLTPAGVETPLYTFTGGSDGANPLAGMIRDSAGNFYGTTLSGGLNGCGGLGCGVVFELSPVGAERVLYRFTGGADGANPYARLVRDSAGNLFGTTSNGGSSNAGVVFTLNASGKETVLYSFTGGGDGGYPRGALLRDSAGHLYGTTQGGGFAGCGGYGCGVIFRVTP